MALSIGARWAIATPALLVLLYILLVGLLLIPGLQRHALYVHKVHSLFWHNVDVPESFGFAKNQIRAFDIATPDGETLLAWHVLPLDTYALHRQALEEAERNSPLATRLLTEDSEAKVIVSFHGNAGHIAQGWRTDTYRSFSAMTHTHTLTIDYRGFGQSTGSPSEAGLITDGIALVNYVLSLGIPPSRIALVGQSLGTAVASAVALYFAEPGSPLLPQDIATSAGCSTPLLDGQDSRLGYLATSDGNSNGTVDAQGRPARVSHKADEAGSRLLFAGTLLIAPFTNVPNLLLTYKAGGVIPLLGPMRPFKFLHPILDWGMADQWPTMLRLKAYLDAAQSIQSGGETDSGRGNIRILHAYNDGDISFRQSTAIYTHLTGQPPPEAVREKKATVLLDRSHVASLTVEFVEHGGHNRVCTYSEVNLAVRQMLGHDQAS